MPTSRTSAILVGAIVLYFFANQTQVGWLYVMCAVLGGAVLSAWWMSLSNLRGVTAERSIDRDELYEGDEARITVTLDAGRASSAQIHLTEWCPLAAPDTSQQMIRLFVPSLPRGEKVQFDYEVSVYKRGVYEFRPLAMLSYAPFGFFRKRRALNAPTSVLVYPEVRSLSRFDLLDRQFAPQVTRPSAGVGYEVMGLRPYRVGDSPRNIHWRTVARTGQLVSKEFADETQPGVTLALDLFHHPYARSQSRDTPFEWAVRVAASIGDFARRRGYPVSLATNDEALPAPQGAVSWYALLQYLARVQPVGEMPLAQALARISTQAFVVVVLPYPDAGMTSYLRELRFRGARVLAVVVDPESFPDRREMEQSAPALVGDLQAAEIETRLIRFGEDWTAQLQGDIQVAR